MAPVENCICCVRCRSEYVRGLDPTAPDVPARPCLMDMATRQLRDVEALLLATSAGNFAVDNYTAARRIVKPGQPEWSGLQ